MVGVHPINKTITIGTFLFVLSMIMIFLGTLFHYFHYPSSVWLSLFFYGILVFFISAIVLLIGGILAAKSGKLQRRFNEILSNTPANIAGNNPIFWNCTHLSTMEKIFNTSSI